MNFSTSSKQNHGIEERIQRIVDLNCKRDQILGLAEVDLSALSILAADYEAAHMPCAAADLQRRLEFYQEREMSVEL